MKNMHEMGKKLIAMGEEMCAMSAGKEEPGEEMEYEETESEDESSDAKKKMIMAMMSKKYGSKES